MLKTMRSSFHKLKWTLFAVIIVFVLGFVFFSGSGPGAADDPGSQVLAEVGGERILAADFDRQYRAQLQQYQQMYQGNFTPQLAKALDLPRQVLDGMVDRILRLEAARRLNLKVSDDEVARKIVTLFQDKGQFIGREKYEKLLRGNGMYPARFEEDLREDLLAQKYGALVRASILVPESDVLREFSNRNEKATIEYILVPASRLESASTPTDPELQSYYDKHRERYRAPEQRRLHYLLVERAKVRSKIDRVGARDQGRVREAAQQPRSAGAGQRGAHPDQGRRGHGRTSRRSRRRRRSRRGRRPARISRSSPTRTPRTTRGRATADGSPSSDGDRWSAPSTRRSSPWRRARSAPVKTEFGHHVIKLDERHPARTRPLEEVRAVARGRAFDRQGHSGGGSDRPGAGVRSSEDAAPRPPTTSCASSRPTPSPTTRREWSAKGEPSTGIGANQQFSDEAWATKRRARSSPTPITTHAASRSCGPSEERAGRGRRPLRSSEDPRRRRIGRPSGARRTRWRQLEPAARELASGATLGPLAQRYEHGGQDDPRVRARRTGSRDRRRSGALRGRLPDAAGAGRSARRRAGRVRALPRARRARQADPRRLETQKAEPRDAAVEEAERLA